MSKDSTEVDLTALPTPDHITLLLKYHKSTTVISVLPTRSFTEIKAILFAALKSRNISALPGSDILLPSKADDIEFGVLADRKDASKGWVPLEVKEQEVKDAKGGKRKIGGKGSILNDSPTGAGLGDGSWIAYRVKSTTRTAAPGTEDLEKGDPAEMELDLEEREWDVVLPSFEDE